jgi:dTDP-4-dehydrorhamnose 3,5-epimerase-like enzyme
MKFDLIEMPPHISDNSGKLGVLDSDFLPFHPKRIYWIFSVKPGESRGNHAHKQLTQFFWLVQGCVTIELSDISSKKILNLRANKDLLVVYPGLWRKLYDFSLDAILLVGADSSYDQEDYIRDWNKYVKWKGVNFEN